MPPLIDCRQCLAGKLCVGHGFVPADSGRGKIGGSLGIGAQGPICGSGPACQVVKFEHGLLPRERMAFLEKWLLPILRFAVAARVDKFLELTIGVFVAVHPEYRKRNTWLYLFGRSGWY